MVVTALTGSSEGGLWSGLARHGDELTSSSPGTQLFCILKTARLPTLMSGRVSQARMRPLVSPTSRMGKGSRNSRHVTCMQHTGRQSVSQ